MASVSASRWTPFLAAAALIAAVGVATPAAAANHAHTGPTGKATAAQLAQPAVVRVETGAQLSVVFHSSNLYTKTYKIDAVRSGSGFIVDPSGTVVTATSNVRIDSRRLVIYGINRIFQDYRRLPLPRDPYTRTSAKDTKTNQELQSCYGRIRTHVSCFVFFTPSYRVYPFVVNPGSGVLAQPLGGIPTRSEVAFLTTNVRNSPTESLSSKPLSSAPHMDADFVAVGYRTRPRPNGTTTPILITGKLVGGRVSPADSKRLEAALGDGLPGTPVAHTSDGDVLGMLTGGGTRVGIFPGAVLSAALSAEGANARSSEVDTAYTAALRHFNIKHYSAAVDDFNRVLTLSNGHALANEYLNVAKAKAGTKEDLTEAANTHEQMKTAGHSAGGSGSWSGPLVIAGLLLAGIALLGAGWLLRRRGRRQGPAASGGTTAPPAPSAMPVRPAEGSTGASNVPAIGNGQDAPRRNPETGSAATPGSGATPSRSTSSVASPESLAGAAAHRGPAARPTSMIQRDPPAEGRLGRHCTQCGDVLSPTNRFCAACGSPVG